MMETRYGRVLLKLSGESLMGEQHYGIDPGRLGEYARQIKEAADRGVQVAIVIGGGNIFRGVQGAAKGFDRVKGDQMGMLATVITRSRSARPSKPKDARRRCLRPLTCIP